MLIQHTTIIHHYLIIAYLSNTQITTILPQIFVECLPHNHSTMEKVLADQLQHIHITDNQLIHHILPPSRHHQQQLKYRLGTVTYILLLTHLHYQPFEHLTHITQLKLKLFPYLTQQYQYVVHYLLITDLQQYRTKSIPYTLIYSFLK